MKIVRIGRAVWYSVETDSPVYGVLCDTQRRVLWHAEETGKVRAGQGHASCLAHVNSMKESLRVNIKHIKHIYSLTHHAAIIVFITGSAHGNNLKYVRMYFVFFFVTCCAECTERAHTG